MFEDAFGFPSCKNCVTSRMSQGTAVPRELVYSFTFNFHLSHSNESGSPSRVANPVVQVRLEGPQGQSKKNDKNQNTVQNRWEQGG